jgi:hypothetical protein
MELFMKLIQGVVALSFFFKKRSNHINSFVLLLRYVFFYKEKNDAKASTASILASDTDDNISV